MIKRYTGVSVTVILITICFSINTYAQHSEYGAFIEPSIKFQSVINQTSFITGARFGFVIHERFSVGGGYYASLNSLSIAPINSQDARLHFNMGGLELESLLFDIKSFRVSVLFFAGAGALYKSSASNSDINYETDNFLVWEPQLLSSTNLLNWFSINIGLGYRFISYTNPQTTSDAYRLKGLFGVVSLKIHTR